MRWGPGELGCWSVASKEPSRARGGRQGRALPWKRAQPAEEPQSRGKGGEGGMLEKKKIKKMMRLLQWIRQPLPGSGKVEEPQI